MSEETAQCIECGWKGLLQECSRDEESESMDGYVIARYTIFQCPECYEWTVDPDPEPIQEK